MRRNKSHESIEEVDESSVGTKGKGALQCVTQVSGRRRSFTQVGSAVAAPGSTIRVSIRCGGRKRKGLGHVARLLAFVDPLTGRLIVRMGMWNVQKSTRGHEEGPQVVWESDVPVCDLDSDTE